MAVRWWLSRLVYGESIGMAIRRATRPVAPRLRLLGTQITPYAKKPASRLRLPQKKNLGGNVQLLSTLRKISRLGWMLPMLVAATWLAGCATLSPPEPVPCPSPVMPPVRLMEPAKSPTTRQRLEQLLPTTSPPVNTTHSG